MPLSQYEVIGRKVPASSADSDAEPIFRMHLFAPSQVVAKSRFWYFLHQLHKLKKTTGEILSCREIREKNSNIVKNYGLTIRYNSRSGTHNMYREYRDTRLAGAVEQMYADMAGRHRARFHSIHIVDTKEVPCGSRAAKRYNPETDGDVPPVTVTRPGIKEFARNSKFPLVHRIQRAATRALRSTFVAQRPTTFFS